MTPLAGMVAIGAAFVLKGLPPRFNARVSKLAAIRGRLNVSARDMMGSRWCGLGARSTPEEKTRCCEKNLTRLKEIGVLFKEELQDAIREGRLPDPGVAAESDVFDAAIKGHSQICFPGEDIEAEIRDVVGNARREDLMTRPERRDVN